MSTLIIKAIPNIITSVGNPYFGFGAVGPELVKTLNVWILEINFQTRNCRRHHIEEDRVDFDWCCSCTSGFTRGVLSIHESVLERARVIMVVIRGAYNVLQDVRGRLLYEGLQRREMCALLDDALQRPLGLRGGNQIF